MIETYKSVAKHTRAYAYDLFDSPHAEQIKAIVKIPETEAAEKELAAIAAQISDPELRARIDEMAGIFARAYERLGFIEGLIAEKSYACIV